MKNDEAAYCCCVFVFSAPRTMTFRDVLARTSLIKTEFDRARRRSLKSTCRKRDRQRERSHSCRSDDARHAGCFGLKENKKYIARNVREQDNNNIIIVYSRAI